jgi:hypothetical protein
VRARHLRAVAPVAVILLTVALTMSGPRAPAQHASDTAVSAVEVVISGGAVLQPTRFRASATKHKSTPYTPPLLAVLGLWAAAAPAVVLVERAFGNSTQVAAPSWRLDPARAPPLSRL